VAGPIPAAAGEEDQVTGEGLVLLDHDDVPDPQLSALLPHQLAVLDEMHRALVHGVVCLMAKPVLIACIHGLHSISYCRMVFQDGATMLPSAAGACA